MEFNLVADMFTIVFLLWNFGVLGMAVIHWKGPLILQQFYLIFVCVQISLRFIKYLPEWTTWVYLIAINKFRFKIKIKKLKKVVLAFLSIWGILKFISFILNK
jgi:hypothetical protein